MNASSLDQGAFVKKSAAKVGSVPVPSATARDLVTFANGSAAKVDSNTTAPVPLVRNSSGVMTSSLTGVRKLRMRNHPRQRRLVNQLPGARARALKAKVRAQREAAEGRDRAGDDEDNEEEEDDEDEEEE